MKNKNIAVTFVIYLFFQITVITAQINYSNWKLELAINKEQSKKLLLMKDESGNLIDTIAGLLIDSQLNDFFIEDKNNCSFISYKYPYYMFNKVQKNEADIWSYKITGFLQKLNHEPKFSSSGKELKIHKFDIISLDSINALTREGELFHTIHFDEEWNKYIDGELKEGSHRLQITGEKH